MTGENLSLTILIVIEQLLSSDFCRKARLVASIFRLKVCPNKANQSSYYQAQQAVPQTGALCRYMTQFQAKATRKGGREEEMKHCQSKKKMNAESRI